MMDVLEIVHNLVRARLEAKYSVHDLPLTSMYTKLNRHEASESKVAEYRTMLRAGKQPKPVHVVMPSGSDKFEIIDGQHRYWAHQDEGRKHITARLYNDRITAFTDV